MQCMALPGADIPAEKGVRVVLGPNLHTSSHVQQRSARLACASLL